MHIFKKNLFIVFIYCFVFFGCSKKQTPINTQPNTAVACHLYNPYEYIADPLKITIMTIV